MDAARSCSCCSTNSLVIPYDKVLQYRTSPYYAAQKPKLQEWWPKNKTCMEADTSIFLGDSSRYHSMIQWVTLARASSQCNAFQNSASCVTTFPRLHHALNWHPFQTHLDIPSSKAQPCHLARLLSRTPCRYSHLGKHRKDSWSLSMPPLAPIEHMSGGIKTRSCAAEHTSNLP